MSTMFPVKQMKESLDCTDAAVPVRPKQKQASKQEKESLVCTDAAAPVRPKQRSGTSEYRLVKLYAIRGTVQGQTQGISSGMSFLHAMDTEPRAPSRHFKMRAPT